MDYSSIVFYATVEKKKGYAMMIERRFEILSETSVYENPWLKVNELKINRDGQPGIYGVVHRQDSVVVIVRDSLMRILVLEQYRFPTDSYSWELPMGGIDEGENPMQAAERELFEETGIRSSNLRQIGSFRPVPGLTPQNVFVFSVLVDDTSVRNEDSVDEIVDRRFVSTTQLKEMVQQGKVSDGFTLSSLMIEVLS